MKLNDLRPVTAFVALAVVTTLGSGCWSRLTNPKETSAYVNSDGTLIGGASGVRMIYAPDYNAILEALGEAGKPSYRLQAGTLLRLEIYGHEIRETVAIRPDGAVDLPLIGEVIAAGRSIQDVKEEISTKYARFYTTAPQVILNTDVTEQDPLVRAGEVSIINPTGTSGVVNLTGDEYLTEALASIRALHPRSEWNQIAIIRRAQKDATERYVIVCDIEALLRSGDLDQDILLRNGDVIFVPHEKNTFLEEFVAFFGVLGVVTGDMREITSYIEQVEGY